QLLSMSELKGYMTSISFPMRKFIGSMGQSQIIDFASYCRPDKAFTPHPAIRQMLFVNNTLQVN
ncbi:hypothetical protein O5824_27850, partial [Escherichia coli]|nr:hypothetical protein [Escherichia coli]